FPSYPFPIRSGRMIRAIVMPAFLWFACLIVLVLRAEGFHSPENAEQGRATTRAMTYASVVTTEPTSPAPASAATVSEPKPTPKNTAADYSTLDGLLKTEGLEVVKLKREQFDKQRTNKKAHKSELKHLIVDAEVNGLSASLMVNTVTPKTNTAWISSRNSILS